MAAENNSQKGESIILNPEEWKALSQITHQDPPFSQRAQALLALDEGVTQSAAAQRAGLTLGQLRYWLDKFRKDRLDIFPAALLEPDPQEEPAVSQDALEPAPLPEIPDRASIAKAEMKEESAGIAETAAPLDKSPAPKKKSKKKSGKAKKSKKAQKEKKGKKGKKSKKGSKEKKPKKKSKKSKKKK